MDEQCTIRCNPKFHKKAWRDTVQCAVVNPARHPKKPYCVVFGRVFALFTCNNEAYVFLSWYVQLSHPRNKLSHPREDLSRARVNNILRILILIIQV